MSGLSISTKSVLLFVATMSTGTVLWGESENLGPGRLAYRYVVGGISPLCTRQFRTESCLHVNLPWLSDSGHELRRWVTVGYWALHKGHMLSVRYCHLRKFRGVGRQSAPARSRKDSCPEGNLVIKRFHTRSRGSRATTYLNLLWTCIEHQRLSEKRQVEHSDPAPEAKRKLFGDNTAWAVTASNSLHVHPLSVYLLLCFSLIKESFILSTSFIIFCYLLIDIATCLSFSMHA